MESEQEVKLTIFESIPDYVDVDNEQVVIDKLIDQMDRVFNSTATNRNKILTKFMEAVDVIKFSEYDKLNEVTKKVMILDTANKILNDSEHSFTTRINTRMKQKDSSTGEATGKIVAELLHKLPVLNYTMNQKLDIPIEDQLQQLSNVCSQNEIKVSDDECKLDPTDVPMMNDQ